MATYFNSAFSATDIRQAKLYTKAQVTASRYYSPVGRGFTVYDGTSEKYPFCSTIDIEGLKKVGKYYTQNGETVYVYEGIPIVNASASSIVETITTALTTPKTYDNSHGLGYLINIRGSAGKAGSAGGAGFYGDYYQGAGNTFSGTGGSGGAGGANGLGCTLVSSLGSVSAGYGYGGGGGGGGAGGSAGSSSGDAPSPGGLGGTGGSASTGETRVLFSYEPFTINEVKFGNMSGGAERGKDGNGSKPSSLFSGNGGKSGDNTAGTNGSSGSGARGGNGGSGTKTFEGNGGTLVNKTNTATQGVYIYKYIVTGIQ